MTDLKSEIKTLNNEFNIEMTKIKAEMYTEFKTEMNNMKAEITKIETEMKNSNSLMNKNFS